MVVLLRGVARQTRLTVTSHHGRRQAVAAALRRIAGFFRALAQCAEQLTEEDRWRRILAEALRKYLHGRRRAACLWTPGQAGVTGKSHPKRPLATSNCRIWVQSLSDGVRRPSFARRRVNSGPSRLRRAGESLGQFLISASVLPQPRHHPVVGSERQTSTHGDGTRLARRFMAEPRADFLRSRS